jgi:hypothetical protein
VADGLRAAAQTIMLPKAAMSGPVRHQEDLLGMTKYKTVTEFLADLPPEKREQVELLRRHISKVEPKLIESIKWNAPNYSYEGVDRITFNLQNKERVVQIIIHKGAVEKEDKKAEPILKDESGLIKWNSNIRGTLSFASIKNIEDNAQELTHIIENWLKL